MRYYSQWPRYVPVAERRAKAEKQLKKLKSLGRDVNPVIIQGRTIAKTFWGKQWCDHLEAYSDYANRLPRGRTYARNGSIIDLQIEKGKAIAQVMGSSLYDVTIEVKPMLLSRWQDLVEACTGKIDSLVELLSGKFSSSVMEIIAERESGLFPKPNEISLCCTCPDFASMCKHIAAVLYGIGATLDHKPEWLFLLRHVDQHELISSATTGALFQDQSDQSDEQEMAELFGIEMEREELFIEKPAEKTVVRARSIKSRKTPVQQPIKAVEPAPAKAPRRKKETSSQTTEPAAKTVDRCKKAKSEESPSKMRRVTPLKKRKGESS